MSANLTITLQVRVTTQKGDRVAVSGAPKVLGEWNPRKIKFMKPKKTLNDSNLWSVKIDLPLSLPVLEYRYLVVRKSVSPQEDDGEDSYIIRHWEAGIFSRSRKILDLGQNPEVDVYGQFDPERKMFVDQGWLVDETEIQLRFYKNPIYMFKKRGTSNEYNVKCSTVNLLWYDFPTSNHNNSVMHQASQEEHFDQMVHASNPLIRVSSLGKYSNKEQNAHGMSICSTDYVIYKLRTLEPECHGVKIDFYTPESKDDIPKHLGYANLLPLHIAEGTGSVSLAINNVHGFPVGQVTVRYLVCKPNRKLNYDMRQCFTKWWNLHRPPLDIGHRGVGDTHSSDINSIKDGERDRTHENTLGSLITAAESGADYVEFDVQLSSDKVPIIWHDFKVSILLRKKRRGEHRVHHIPVHELSYSQLKELRVDFVKGVETPDHVDHPDAPDETTPSGNLSPFPTLKEALELVDQTVGFYVELKYPQTLYESKTREEGLESYMERNEYIDPVLEVLYQYAQTRRIVLASFDPDVCILARLKQNRYPVILLIEDMGSEATPYYHDIRTHRITTAISVARSEKFLGLSVNAAALMRNEEDLLNKILDEHLICFVWGPTANNADVRKQLRSGGVHAICYDEIEKKGGPSVYRVEQEEKLRKLLCHMNLSPGISPCPSLPSSRGSSLLGSAPNLLEVISELELGKYGTSSSALLSKVNHSSTNNSEATSGYVTPPSPDDGSSTPKVGTLGTNEVFKNNDSVDTAKADKTTDSSPVFTLSPPKNNSSRRGHDYTTEFY